MENKQCCSFCGRQADEANFMFTNKDKLLYICDQCLEEFCQALANSKQSTVEDIKSEFDLTPEKIKAILDQYIIGQEQAKKILSVAVYNHYKLLNYYDRNKDIGDTVEISKSNILICGPSGVGL